jgi:large conductance mechanosensitive channel
MLKGFKEFIMRGNLIELAVAFVMAAAFGLVVKAFVNIIMSLIGKIGSQPNFDDIAPGGVPVGAFITTLVAFVVLAAVVYFGVVMPYNALQERRAKGEEAEPPSDDVALLTEIRDLLARQGGAGSRDESSGQHER